MGTIRAMVKQVRKLNLPVEIVKSIEKTSPVIIKLNQTRLYGSSVDSLGLRLKSYRSKQYAEFKFAMNPLPGLFRPDLYLTGAFFRGFHVTVGYTGIFTIDSTDSKTPKLEQQYGPQIFGLTRLDKIDYATGAFYEELKTRITGKTGLRFR